MRAQEPVRGSLFLPLRFVHDHNVGQFRASIPSCLPVLAVPRARTRAQPPHYALRGEASSNCSRLSEASVSELRSFNGFRLASGVKSLLPRSAVG